MQEEGTQVHNYVYSSGMMEFVQAANGYCTFMEKLKGTEGRAFIIESVKHLSAIYSTFLKTGESEPVLDSQGESSVTEQEGQRCFSEYP